MEERVGAVLLVGPPATEAAAAVAVLSRFTSEPESAPLALRSQRKLAPLTSLPAATAALQVVTSEPERTPLELMSPKSVRKETGWVRSFSAAALETLESVTVSVWASVTFASFTVIVLAEKVGEPLTVA